jgi:hypothetical protein
MTPNLYLCLRKAATPHTWIPSKQHQTDPEDHHRIEHWDSPVPGYYEFIPGRGWYLMRRDSDSDSDYESDNLSLSSRSSKSSSTSSKRSSASRSSSRSSTYGKEEMQYCRILHRYFLASELEARCRWEPVVRREGAKPTLGRFFQLDDGVAWVLCWDENGRFILGPYRKWCLDKETGYMRPMTRMDELAR